MCTCHQHQSKHPLVYSKQDVLLYYHMMLIQNKLHNTCGGEVCEMNVQCIYLSLLVIKAAADGNAIL